MYNNDSVTYVYDKSTNTYNTLFSNASYEYVQGLGKPSDKVVKHYFNSTSDNYIKIYKVDTKDIGSTATLIAEATNLTRSGNYPSFFGYKSGKLFGYYGSYGSTGKGQFVAYNVDEELGTIDYDNPTLFPTPQISSSWSIAQVYTLTDNTCLLSCSSSALYLVTINDDLTISYKKPSSIFTDSELSGFYSQDCKFNVDTNSWAYALNSDKCILDFRYSEDANDIYLKSSFDVSSFAPVGSVYAITCSNISSLGYVLVQRGQYRSYASALYSLDNSVTTFKAKLPYAKNYTDISITGYTTGNTDEEGRIEISTVLPPILSVDLETEVDADIVVEGEA